MYLPFFWFFCVCVRLIPYSVCSVFFSQPEQCFSHTTIQPEQCFSASFNQNSASRTGPLDSNGRCVKPHEPSDGAQNVSCSDQSCTVLLITLYKHRAPLTNKKNSEEAKMNPTNFLNSLTNRLDIHDIQFISYSSLLKLHS